VVLVVNTVVVWVVVRTFMERNPTRKELGWLWSSWRNPLSVAMWGGVGWDALYLGHAGLAALHDNPWFIGLLALIVVNSANAISSYYRSNLSADRPAIFVSVEPDDGDAYDLVVTNTLSHPAHDVRVEVMDGDIDMLSSPALSLLLDRGIGSLRIGETRYPLLLTYPCDRMTSPIKLKVSWHDKATLPGDKPGSQSKHRSRVSCVDPYEVLLRSTSDGVSILPTPAHDQNRFPKLGPSIVALPAPPSLTQRQVP